MNIRPIAFMVATSASLWLAEVNAAELKTNPTAPSPLPAVENSTVKSDRPVLKPGMSAEEVRRLVGTPEAILPMEAPEGKAETWNYRRVLNQQTRQVATTTTNIPAFNGLPRDMGTEVQLSYRLERTTVYQVSSLLMFDGKLVVAKQWQSKSVSYDN